MKYARSHFYTEMGKEEYNHGFLSIRKTKMLCCCLLVIQNNRENAERADYLSRSLFLLFLSRYLSQVLFCTLSTQEYPLRV